MVRRTPKGEERRRLLCDAAIQVLAAEGAKGLSHPKVDQWAGVARGTTSFYFRTRAALLQATTERVCELDLADLSSALHPAPSDDAVPHVSPLAVLVAKSAREPGLRRTKARFELVMQASRDPSLAAIFHDNMRLFADLQRDIVIRSQPGRDLDPAVVNEQTAATLNFVSGLFMSLIAGQRPFDDAEHLDRLLTGIVNGIAAAYQEHAHG